MHLRKQFFGFLLLLAGSIGICAQGIDPDYFPEAARDQALSVGPMIPLPGSQILGYTSNFEYGTVLRVNADGSTDRSFICACVGLAVRTMAVQPDGKYILAGSRTPGDNSSPDIIRINHDGSLDSTFTSPFPSNQSFADVHAITPEGKIYAIGLSGNDGSLYRLNSDGSIDSGFTPIFFINLGTIFTAEVDRVTPLTNGQLYITGKNIQPGPIFRANADGSVDSTFNQPVYEPAGAVTVSRAIPQPDGKVVISGNFTKVNGLTRGGVARLNADGSVDSASTPLNTQGGWTAFPQSDGKIILFNTGLYRLNADLTRDDNYAAGGALGPIIVDSFDRVVSNGFDGLFRLNYDGTSDNTFSSRKRASGMVASLAVQGDGKVIAAGSFEWVNGLRKRSLIRLNPDGTIDSSLDTGFGFLSGSNVGSISKVVIEPSGKIIVLGDFDNYNGTHVSTFARISSNGAFDASFAPTISGVVSIGVQPDGKILLFGGSMGVNGFARTMVARLNNDGTIDGAFNPQVPSPVFGSAFLQPDGKILIGGTFSTVNGVGRQNLARLNSDGSLDASFDAGPVLPVNKTARQADGKYLFAPKTGSSIFRIGASGTADPSFISPSINAADVSVILPEAGGGVILGGAFLTPQAGILRLRSDGSLDNGFLAPGASGAVRDMARQPDRKIVVAGKYYSIGGIPRLSLSRINAKPVPFDFNGDEKSDFMVTRPSDYNWHLLTNGTYNYTAVHFGATGDKVVPADYDGDGKTDIAIWRPSNGEWWWQASSTGNVFLRTFGTNGDTPMPSDTDGDGKADLVVVSPGLLWKGMKAGTGELIVYHQFGQSGDKPVVGDFDGDGKSDLAYFRPSNGTWYYNKSSSRANLELGIVQWGLSTDIPAPADYDGDGKTDVAVYRPSEGNWYVLNSGGGYLIVHFGATGDKPIPADYDGDGKADIAVFRPSDGYWYQLLTTGGYTGLPWGISSDIPAPNALLIP